MQDLTTDLKNQAFSLGFVLAGVTAAATPGRLNAFHQWLDSGYHGQMRYLEDRRAAYSHPKSILEGCRTILMLAVPYDRDDPREQVRFTHPGSLENAAGSLQSGSGASESPARARGKVARYARSGNDYHDILHARLKRLRSWILQRRPDAAVRGVVDTAPLLEREFAEAAGLGWIGKNTLLLNRKWGSYFFLAALLTDLPLALDAPDAKSYCGTCTACLDACPTKAFPEPFVLDARRCISYLTIEYPERIEEPLAAELNQWLFGCDICQEVCPWNRRVPGPDHEFQTQFRDMDLNEILACTPNEFRARFRNSPLWRSKRRGLLRNAILIAGTDRLAHCVNPLIELLDDEEVILREAAAWAIARIQPEGWQAMLRTTR